MSNIKKQKLIPKSLWSHGNNQHRIVFLIRDGNVFYGSRGGNVLNEFKEGKKCKIDTFLKDCEYIKMFTDEEWEKSRKELKAWIATNNL